MLVLGLDETGDLELTNGDLTWITGRLAVRQSIQSRCRMFLGEWFLDLRQGIPYFRHILVKNPDLAVVRVIFRRVILGTPGVLAVNNLNLALDIGRRILALSFEAQGADEPIQTPEDPTFIVEV